MDEIQCVELRHILGINRLGLINRVSIVIYDILTVFIFFSCIDGFGLIDLFSVAIQYWFIILVYFSNLLCQDIAVIISRWNLLCFDRAICIFRHHRLLRRIGHIDPELIRDRSLLAGVLKVFIVIGNRNRDVLGQIIDSLVSCIL